MPRREKEHPGQVGDYWLSYRPNSPYVCRTWFDKAGGQTRRRSLGTTDFREAKLRLAQWVTVHGSMHQERPADVPLATLLVRYWERHGSKAAMAPSIKAHLACWAEFFGEATVAELTADRQERFLDWLRAKRCARNSARPYSSSTLRKIIAAGAAALHQAHKRQEIAAVLPIVKVEERNPRMRRLEVAEVAAFLDAIEADHLYLFVMLALNTLSRPGALLELRREQCSLVDRLIFLNPDGREQTKKFRPVVPITDTLLPLIKAAPPGPLVQWRGRPVRQLDRVWRETVARAELGEGVDRMTLRRTMARELRRRGVPPWDASGIMGHASETYDTTEIYAEYDPNYLSRAVAAIDGFMSDVGRVAARPTIRLPQQERSSSVLAPFPETTTTPGKTGAGDGNRTHDIQLGKLSFYH